MPRMLVAMEPSVAGFKDYEDRTIKSDEIKCRVLYAAPKHGTELTEFKNISVHAREKYDPEWQLFVPREDDEPNVVFGEWNLGNQWVGEVVEVGAEVKDFRIGDHVCSYGGIRETHIIRAVDNYRCRRVSDLSLWKNALCYDPAQFALGAVRDAHVRPGDGVAVYGMGAIGLLAAQMCVKLGADPVIVIDPIRKRCDIALHNGAHFAFDPLSGVDIGLKLKELTGKRGVDVVIETSGQSSSLQSALRGLAYGGTIAFVAFAKPFNHLELGREAHFNNAKIVFSRACSEPLPDYPRWSRRRIEDVVWNMLMSGYLNCEEIIQPVVPFDEADEAYMRYVDREPMHSVKLGIRND